MPTAGSVQSGDRAARRSGQRQPPRPAALVRPGEVPGSDTDGARRSPARAVTR